MAGSLVCAGWRVQPEHRDEKTGGHAACSYQSVQSLHASQKQLGEELVSAVGKGESARVLELIASGADVDTRNHEVRLMFEAWTLTPTFGL